VGNQKLNPKQSNRWHLYWVESDGIEDCFVVARNSRSAARVEIYENGFDDGDVRATKILSVPEGVAEFYQAQGTRKWPWYVYGKPFFEKLGAQFRTISGKHEMLLEDVVYEVEDYVPCSIYKARSIGRKAFDELNSEPYLGDYEYHEEDIWEQSDIHLFAALGMCVATCQQIEEYIANSFLLRISKKQKQQFGTINELKEGWKKKTLGNMIKCIEEAWNIEPMLKANLLLFVSNRNRLIHGITTDDQYDVRTLWGQKELMAFLHFFHLHARIVKSAFRASYYASVEFGFQKWGLPKGLPRDFKRRVRKEAELFFVFFTPKEREI
jgi:hypothetical protein